MESRDWSELLVGEHEMIERAMDVLKGELVKLPSGAYDPWTIQRATDFLLEFGDRIHNQKEEQVLFPLMVERGIPESGPIRVMLMEHEAERTLLQQMYDQSPALEQATVEARSVPGAGGRVPGHPCRAHLEGERRALSHGPARL